MRNLTIPAALVFAAFLALPSCKDEVAGAAADNTASNERDRDGTNTTPIDQKNNENDLQIVQDIRKALVDSAQLSLNAHNVKVISTNGVVTLRGPVESSAERTSVENIAKAVSGVARIDNQIEVVTTP